MCLPDKAIEEFKQIYKKETGITLSYDEAIKKANKFFNFMKLITKPTKKKNQ